MHSWRSLLSCAQRSRIEAGKSGQGKCDAKGELERHVFLKKRAQAGGLDTALDVAIRYDADPAGLEHLRPCQYVILRDAAQRLRYDLLLMSFDSTP